MGFYYARLMSSIGYLSYEKLSALSRQRSANTLSICFRGFADV